MIFLYLILFIDNVEDSKYEDDTKIALQEMNKLFRHLFPLIPDKAHYIWKSSHLGGSLTLDEPRISNHRQHAKAFNVIDDDNVIDRPAPVPPLNTNSRPELSPNYHQNIRYSDPLDNRDNRERDETVPIINEPKLPYHQLPTTTNKHQIKSSRRLPPPLGKRGPECMRKCIAQGVLHPVQCHSLC